MSGCFDMFHDGHRHILRTALDILEKRDSLFILMNEDSSVRKFKGRERPIDSLLNRKQNVRDFCNTYRPSIDTYIYSFDTEKKLLDLYNSLKPSMILHGDDIRDVHTVTGFPEFPVIIVDRGYDRDGNRTSTTKLIEEKNG